MSLRRGKIMFLKYFMRDHWRAKCKGNVHSSADISGGLLLCGVCLCVNEHLWTSLRINTFNVALRGFFLSLVHKLAQRVCHKKGNIPGFFPSSIKDIMLSVLVCFWAGVIKNVARDFKCVGGLMLMMCRDWFI